MSKLTLDLPRRHDIQKNSMHLASLAILFFASIFSVSSYAAGFNCKSKTLSSIESLICTNSDLSRMDELLNKIFKDALRESDEQEKQQLIKQQRQWITEVRNKCSQNQFACLNKAYNSRYDELADTYSEARKHRMLENELPELSRRSGLSIDKIKDVLSNCTETDRNMRICSNLFSLRAKLVMDVAFAQKLEISPPDCRNKLQAAQKQWEENMWGQCEKESQDEFGYGSDATLSSNVCMELGIEARTVQIKTIRSCDELPPN